MPRQLRLGFLMTDKSPLNREGVVSVAAVLGFAAIFGIWWSAANPVARLDKIEQTATQLAKDIGITYATIHSHEDLQARLLSDIAELKRRDEEARNLSLTKSQFEAWKTERDMYLSEMMKRMDRIRSDVHDLELRRR